MPNQNYIYIHYFKCPRCNHYANRESTCMFIRIRCTRCNRILEPDETVSKRKEEDSNARELIHSLRQIGYKDDRVWCWLRTNHFDTLSFKLSSILCQCNKMLKKKNKNIPRTSSLDSERLMKPIVVYFCNSLVSIVL